MQTSSRLQCRHLLSALVFLGFFNVYTMRVNLSVAIVAMVKTPEKSLNGTNENENTCPVSQQGNSSSTSKKGEFEWTEYEQGVILSSFFYSYLVVNLFGGRLAEVFGVKLTYGIGILNTAILTLLTPLVARWSYYAFIVLRVIEGGMEGVTFPASHCLASRWYNRKERGFVVSLFTSGATMGSIVSMLVSGYLCDSDFLGGWPSAFYVFGAIGCIWSVFWFALMHEFPEDHPRISERELNYIKEGKEKTLSNGKPVPWKKILSSIPVWACALSALARNWTFSIINYSIPTYLKNILHYDIAKSGLLSSLPNIAEFVMMLCTGSFADWILSKRFMSVDTTRKVVNSVGLIPPIVCLLGITFSGCNGPMIISFLVISLGALGICIAGYATSVIDMSPTFAGTIMGFVNGFSQFSAIFAPYSTGILTNGNQTVHQWHKVFYISSAISGFALLSFALFGSANLQDWSQEKDVELRNSNETRK